MKSLKLLVTSIVVLLSFSVTTFASDTGSQKFSYELNGSTFSAEYKEGKILKLVRNKKVVYRASRNIRQSSVKNQIKKLSRNLKALINTDATESDAERKSLEDKIIAQMNKITIRLSRK